MAIGERKLFGRRTYVVEPGHLVRLGIRVDVALEVHVVALLNVVGIQIGSHLQTDCGGVCRGRDSGIYLLNSGN